VKWVITIYISSPQTSISQYRIPGILEAHKKHKEGVFFKGDEGKVIIILNVLLIAQCFIIKIH